MSESRITRITQIARIGIFLSESGFAGLEDFQDLLAVGEQQSLSGDTFTKNSRESEFHCHERMDVLVGDKDILRKYSRESEFPPTEEPMILGS